MLTFELLISKWNAGTFATKKLYIMLGSETFHCWVLLLPVNQRTLTRWRLFRCGCRSGSAI